MDELDFYGKIIYREGWFLYFRRHGEVCVLTREDARMIEYSYYNYKEYERSQDSMARMHEGTYPFEEYGFRKVPPFSSIKFKVDELAPASQDFVIEDVLEIPECVDGHTINSICDYSFCKLKIKKIILPKSVTLVNKRAFSDCGELTEFITAGTVKVLRFAFENCKGLETQDGMRIAGNVLLGVTSDFAGSLTIPDNIDSIVAEVFYNNKTITSVSFPKGIKFIGAYAFRGCENLRSTIFEDGVSNLKIEEGIFFDCNNLAMVKLPEGLTEISRSMFYNCEALSDIRIPETVHNVHRGAFNGTGIYRKFKKSSDSCLYIDHWLIEIKTEATIEKLRIKDGTVGVAEDASVNRRETAVNSVFLSPSVRYVNDDAFTHLQMSHVDLSNVERVGKRALGHGCYTTLHVPKTCVFFDGGNLIQNVMLKDVYFYNPDIEVGNLICKSGDGENVRIHGFSGSMVEIECATNPYNPPIEFIADMK